MNKSKQWLEARKWKYLYGQPVTIGYVSSFPDLLQAHLLLLIGQNKQP